MKASEERIAAMLRVYPFEGMPDLEEAKKILDLQEGDPAAANICIDSEYDMLTVVFSAGEPLVTGEDKNKWVESEFRTATEWLRKRTSEQILELREACLRVDIVLIHNLYPIPHPLMAEILRLGIEVFVM